MIRKTAGLLFVLLFVAGLAMAAQDTKEAKKGGTEVDFPYDVGTFESYKGEILTLKVDNKVKEYKVPGDTVVGYATGKKADKVKQQKAKEHLKDVKEGSIVTVTFDRQRKKVLALAVIVSEPPQNKPKNQDEESDR